MRKLMWFAVGFGAACGICSGFLWNHFFIYLAVFFLLSGCGLTIFRRKWAKTSIPILLSFGLGIGMFWFSIFNSWYIQPLNTYDGETISLQITSDSYCRRNRFSDSFSGTTLINGRTYKVIVYLNEKIDIYPGDVIEADFRVRLTTPEGMKGSVYYQGNGVYLTASQKGSAHTERPSAVPLRCMPAVIANSIKENLRNCFPLDTFAFAEALLIGETSDLTYAEDTALKISGIRHIAAVSGLHVSFLYGLVYFLCRKRKWITLLTATPILLLFAAITGFTPSVTRACVMTFVMMLGSALFEEYDSATALSFACLLMMLYNPYVVRSVSFQLSVSSVAGILLFAEPVFHKVYKMLSSRWHSKVWEAIRMWFAGSLSVSVSAMIVTAPISAYYFGTVSLVGIAANLLTIWAVGIIFCGAAFVGVFGAFWGNLSAFVADIVSWFIRYVLFAAKMLSSFRFSAVYTESVYIVCWLIFVYVLFFAFLVFRKHFKYCFLLGTASLAIAIALSVYIPGLDDFRLSVLDVGEGQCILIQSHDQYFMVDCGGNSDTGAADAAAQFLLSQGINHLDGIALTHYDYDHAGGLENFLSRIGTNALYLPLVPGKDSDELYAQYVNVQPVMISENTCISLGGGSLTLSAPGNLKSENENCMCVLFESPECDILITGDRGTSGEKRLMKSMQLPDVDIYIAGHHGSKNSTSEELLQVIKPEIVIISVGDGNTYGHPAQAVLDRLEKFDCTVYRTDIHGNVVVRR